MCGFIGEVNLETPQQSKVFDANLKLKNRGPDSQKIGYINENLEFNISENFCSPLTCYGNHYYFSFDFFK